MRGITWFLMGAMTGATLVFAFRKVREECESAEAGCLTDRVSEHLEQLESRLSDAVAEA